MKNLTSITNNWSGLCKVARARTTVETQSDENLTQLANLGLEGDAAFHLFLDDNKLYTQVAANQLISGHQFPSNRYNQREPPPLSLLLWSHNGFSKNFLSKFDLY